MSCKGTDSKDKGHQLSQEVNPNTHQCTMSSARFQPAISTPLSPARWLIIIDSDTEAESLSPYVNDDNDSASIIKNQAGFPKSQHHIANSSPSPEASDGVNHGVLNNNSKFVLKERCTRAEFLVS
jgi:hypothetical protein